MAFPRIDVRINAATKEVVEGGIERFPFQQGATNLVPRECRQMTDVENKWMAPNDRLGQDSVRRNDRENLIGSRPRRDKPISQKLDFAWFKASQRQCHSVSSLQFYSGYILNRINLCQDRNQAPGVKKWSVYPCFKNSRKA